MKQKLTYLAIATAAFCSLYSCSNTRVLSEGQYRLASNKVSFNGDPAGLKSSDVSSYIKQQTSNAFLFGWIYNWSDPAKDDWLNRSLRKIGTAPVVFNGHLLGSSCENISRHLDYLGYYNSQVTAKVDTVKKNVKVTYIVTPGTRCRIDSIVYKLPKGEFSDEFKADLGNTLIKEGSWLSEKELEQESARSSSYFRNIGYYDVSKFNYFFEADTLGPRNILTYEIRNYTRNEPEINADRLRKYHVGKVLISHAANVPFREKLLKNINTIHPGDLYSEKQTNVNYSRYASLQVFNNVGIEMTPVDSSTVDCHITLGQGRLKGIKANLEASSSANGLLSISPAISFYNKNIFHGGEWLSVGFTGNFQHQFSNKMQANEFGVNASLSLPRFLGLPYSVIKGPNIPRTVFQSSFNYQNRPEFKRYIANVSFGYTGIRGKLSYQVYPLRASVVKVDNMSDEFLLAMIAKSLTLYDSFYDHIDAGLSSQLYWRTDPSVVPKGSYNYCRINFDIAGNTLALARKIFPGEAGSDPNSIFGLAYAKYVRLEASVGQTVRFSPGSALAFRITGGAGYSYEDSIGLPFDKYFSVGGASSMRGWQVRTLGPGNSPMMDFFSIPSQLGDSKLEIDLEYRQKLFWKFEGAVFAEAGNIWNFVDLFEPWINTVALDWGIGLRLNLDFILLRLDWGLRLHDPARSADSRWVSPAEWVSKNGSALHFGVGYPF